MYSNPEYSYKEPIYLQPVVHPVKYENGQEQSYQGEEVKLSTPETYQSNGGTFEQYETTNYSNQINYININNYTQNNEYNQSYPIYSFGEENLKNEINITNEGNIINSNNQYDYTNDATNFEKQGATFNEYNVSNTPNYSEYSPYETTNQANQIASYYQENTDNATYQQNEVYTQNQTYEKPYIKLAENISENIINTTNEIKQSNEVNQITSYYQDNTDNVAYQQNEVYTENQTYENPTNTLVENISDNIINATNEIKQPSVENPIYSVNLSQAYDKSGVNQINQIYTNESTHNNLNSINEIKSPVPELKISAQSDINKDREKEFLTGEKIEKKPTKIDSPRLINPLSSPRPPSPILISKQKVYENENENVDKQYLATSKNLEEQRKLQESQSNNEKKFGSNILTPDEKGLLQTEKKNMFKDYDIKSHYELTLIKEPFGFNYKNVHKTGILLLSHFEMPQNYNYRSPLLSPNGKYLSCIAHGKEDFVYIWDVSDLYWYKYKFSSSKVDGIAFTPDSNSIIIVYRYANPTMYNLSNGKKILDLEGNEEENKREGFQCFKIINGKDGKTGAEFAYTTDRSFTLWDLMTGEVKHKILDDSPIKIISKDYLICISDDLNVLIKRISTQEDVASFKLKGVESTNDILDARFADDMSSFLYVIKDGIIKYTFNDNEYKGIQKFDFPVVKAKISDDCKYVFKTNMQNISIFDITKQDSICTLLKEKFKDCRVDFSLKKVVVIDDISIDIQQIDDDGAPEKYVWLDKNPKKFEDLKFSRDCKVLLARTNRNNAIVYDLKTGYIVKKWQNIDENWLDYAMTKYGGDNIATKSHLLLVRVWNFATGREEGSFYGFDSHSFCFSGNGLYLACGTKCGSEIARIWDIYKQKYGIFKYNGSNNNFHTVVHLTNPEPKYLICCAVDQPPLVFNTHSRELLFYCECPYRFEEVYGIQSDLLYNIFIVKGKDEQKRNVGVLYKLSDGSLLETYENYSVLELAKNNGAIVVKCENINGGKLSAINVKNLGSPITNDFQIQANKCKLLEDYKFAVIEYGDDYNKEFNFINVESGNLIGKINFLKKKDRKAAACVTVDPYTREMYFRYLELLSPQETMMYKKKDIFNVEDE